MRRLALALVCVALVAGVAAARAQTPPPSSPSPPPASAPPAPASSAATPAPAPTAVPSPTPAYNFVYRPAPSTSTTPFPDPGAPEIDEIDLSDAAVKPPAVIRVRVLTNDAVVSMNAETLGETLAIPKTATDTFGFEAAIPDIPSYLRNRSYDVSFVATSKNGRTATITLPLVLK